MRKDEPSTVAENLAGIAVLVVFVVPVLMCMGGMDRYQRGRCESAGGKVLPASLQVGGWTCNVPKDVPKDVPKGSTP